MRYGYSPDRIERLAEREEEYNETLVAHQLWGNEVDTSRALANVADAVGLTVSDYLQLLNDKPAEVARLLRLHLEAG